MELSTLLHRFVPSSIELSSCQDVWKRGSEEEEEEEEETGGRREEKELVWHYIVENREGGSSWIINHRAYLLSSNQSEVQTRGENNKTTIHFVTTYE